MYVQANDSSNNFRKGRLQIGLVRLSHCHRKWSIWKNFARFGTERATRTRDLGYVNAFRGTATNLYRWICVCHRHSRCDSCRSGRHFVGSALFSTRKIVSDLILFLNFFHMISRAPTIYFISFSLWIIYVLFLADSIHILKSIFKIFFTYVKSSGDFYFSFIYFVVDIFVFVEFRNVLRFCYLAIFSISGSKNCIWMLTLCKSYNIQIITISRQQVWKV